MLKIKECGNISGSYKVSMINYTIIIPHYNCPELLMRCLRSIPMRGDVQVIVVDDCSPGFNDYRGQYEELSRPYVEVYSTPQGGSAGRARNVGLKHAKGKWLTFADADDFFDEKFEEMMDRYVDNDADIIYFNRRSVHSDDITKPATRQNHYDTYFKKYEKDGNEDLFRFAYDSPVSKFIKASLVLNNNIQYDEIRYGNDCYFSTATGCVAKKILPVNYPLYVVTVRDGSLTSSFNKKPNELVTRAWAAIHCQSEIYKHGYKYENQFSSMLATMVIYKDYRNCLRLLHTLPTYGISKMTAFRGMIRNAKRHAFVTMILFALQITCELFHVKSKEPTVI